MPRMLPLPTQSFTYACQDLYVQVIALDWQDYLYCLRKILPMNDMTVFLHVQSFTFKCKTSYFVYTIFTYEW